MRVFTRDSRYVSTAPKIHAQRTLMIINSSFFGVIQTAARALSETIRQPALSLSVPSTPPATYMCSSASDLATKTPGPSTSTSMTSIGSASLSTPAHNNYMTVPVDFTPRKTVQQTPGSQTPGHNNYMTVPLDFTPRSPVKSARKTRARTREEDAEAGYEGSPATKRTKKSA